MALQFAALQPGVVLAATATPLYTVPTARTALVKQAVFTNASSAAVTITVNVARSGGGSLVLISQRSLAANSSFSSAELAGLVLLAGDAVTATASAAASVNAFMSGIVQ